MLQDPQSAACALPFATLSNLSFKGACGKTHACIATRAPPTPGRFFVQVAGILPYVC